MEAFRQKIYKRKVGDLIIVFRDKQTIIAERENDKYLHVFERWFIKEKGFYAKSWARFSTALKTRKNITLVQIYELANYYDIDRHLKLKIGDVSELKLLKK